jgi:hypothetical protein
VLTPLQVAVHTGGRDAQPGGQPFEHAYQSRPM